MRRRILSALVIAIVIVVAGVGIAHAATFTTNGQCLDCHARSGSQHDSTYVLDSGTTTFTVGAVDFSAACSKCHWVGNGTIATGSMPYQTTSHNYSSSSACSGSGCHTAPYSSVNGMAVPKSLVTSMGSYFYSADSYKLDAETLHRIHSNPRWPAQADIVAGGPIPGQSATVKAKYTLHCASCHAAASCNDCHADDSVSPDHAVHTTATVTSLVGHGTTVGDQSVVSAGTLAQTCVSANCHPASGIVGGTYFDSAASNTVKVGAWTLTSGGQFYGGSAIKSNGSTATVSASVSGAEFSVYGFKLTTGGYALISVDGNVVATVNCYSTTQSGSTELYRGNLTAGPHTITVANSNQPGAGLGKYITLDYIAVYSTAYSKFQTHDCIDCHVLPTQSANGIDAKDRREPHGYDTAQHSDVQAAEVDGVFGQMCSRCHAMDMMTVHSTQMRHGQPTGCGVCHSKLPGDSMPAADWVRANGVWDTGGLAHKCEACHGNFAAASAVPSMFNSMKHYRYAHDIYKPITLISGDVSTWKHSPAVFSLTATDEAFGSGVVSTHYTLDGGADTAYSTPVSVTKEGTTTVRYWSVDASGNVEVAGTAYVLVDDHAPTVVGAATTPANSAGWYKSDVTVHFTATDALSGVDEVSPDVTLSSQSANLSASGSATDVAGNRGTTTVSDIRIDKAAPVTLSDAVSSYSGTSTVTLTPTDNLSGVAHTYYSFDGGVTVQEGTSAVEATPAIYSLTYWSVDLAGNVEGRHTAEYMVWPANAKYTYNRQCLDCHSQASPNFQVSSSSAVTFTASPVDFGSACSKCHWVGDQTTPQSSMPYTTLSHSYGNANCSGTGCHAAPYSKLNGMAVPHSYVASMSSYFYSDSSYLDANGNVDAEKLHRIHENPAWSGAVDITVGGSIPGLPSRKGLYDLRCPSCHQAASCSACHGDLEHANHQSIPGTTVVGNGTPVGDQGVLDTSPGVSCMGPNCHPMEVVSSGVTYGSTDTFLVKTGAWTTVSGVQYSDGSAIKSNANPSSISLTLSNVASGTEFSYWGFRLPLGDEVFVTVDGEIVDRADCYAPVQSGSLELYRGTLSAGDHTITLNNSQINSRLGGSGKFMTFDGFSVYPVPYATKDGNFRPTCGTFGCHIDRVLEHGFDYTKHTVPVDKWTAAYQAAVVSFPYGATECSSCHSSPLSSTDALGAHPGKVCATCHNDAASKAVISGGWLSKRCTECHGASTHDTYTTSHAITGGSCANSGPSCHGAGSDLAALHSHARNGSAPKYAGCADCHTSMDSRPEFPTGYNPANPCGSGSGGCHTDITSSHPGKVHVLAKSASDAAGCTNSGLGCHGSETRPQGSVGTTNVTVATYESYHANNGCVNGACHASSSQPSATPPLACGGCHSSNYQGAPVVASVASHYVATTHTPDAADVTSALNSGGTASATCADCHTGGGASDLAAQHSATAASTCSGCHAAATGVVTASWSTKRCAACHVATLLPLSVQHASAVPSVIGTDTNAGCSGATWYGCHQSYDLHVLHKGSASSGATLAVNGCFVADGRTGSGCHSKTQKAVVPTSKSCGVSGACHTVGYHKDTGYHTDSVTSETACFGVDCHATSADLTSVHATATAAGGRLNATYTSTCDLCHRNLSAGRINWTALRAMPTNAVADCANCHNVAGRHANQTAQHSLTASSTACLDSGCHSSDIVAVHKNHCSACHNDPATWSKTADCASCHTGYTATNHNGVTGTDALHTASNSSMLATIGVSGSFSATDAMHPGGSYAASRTCGDCHAADLVGAHVAGGWLVGSKVSTTAISCLTGGAGNRGCHNETSPVNAVAVIRPAMVWNKTCAQCHGAPNGAAYHPTALSATHLGNCGTWRCPDCHSTMDLSKLHAGLTGHGCSQSHDATGYSPFDCHSNKNVAPKVIACGEGLGGCHTNKTDCTHFDHVHVLDISRATAEGCVNNGAGCHGTELRPQGAVGTTAAGPADFENPYHPWRKGESTASACFWTPCHSNEAQREQMRPPLACLDCHGNNASSTAATFTASDWIPNTTNGHYHEASHTVLTSAAAYPSINDSSTAYGACSLCHSGYERSAHTTTTVGTISCATGGTDGKGCHNSTVITAASTVVHASFNETEDPTTAHRCIACHAVSSVHGSITTTHQVATDSLGCASGAGCHSGNLMTIHNANACGACHGVDKVASIRSCGAGTTGCHTSYSVSNHGGNGGNDSTHTVTAASLTATVGVYSAGSYDDSRTCAACHAATLTTAHTGTRIGTLTCANCHNETTPINSVAIIKPAPGTFNKTCTQCHGAKTTFHGSNVATAHTGTHPGYSCNNTGCHNTDDLRIIHAKKQTSMYPLSAGCSNSSDGTRSPFGCHTAVGVVPTQTACGAGNGGCHQDKTGTNHGYNEAQHTATAAGSKECVECHQSYRLSVIHHDNCAWCHSGPFGNLAGAAYSAECTACHNATRMGRAYLATITATTGERVLPHYSIAASGYPAVAETHTVSSWDTSVTVPNTNGLACTTCHPADLWGSHNGPTVGSLDSTALAKYPDNHRCTTCHSLFGSATATTTVGFSNVATSQPGWWASRGTSAGRCSACHTTTSTIAPHTSAVAMHDGTNAQLANPGSYCPTISVVATTFGTTTTWPSVWARSDTTNVSMQTTTSRSGAAIRITSNSSTPTTRSVTSSPGANVATVSAQVSFWYQTSGLGAGDTFLAEETTDGARWQPIFCLTDTQTVTGTWKRVIASGLPNGSKVAVRFSTKMSSAVSGSELVYVDDFAINRETARVALAAGATAEKSCSQEIGCHDVTDVRAIHSLATTVVAGDTRTSCRICHPNASTTPTSNCQVSGCHPSVNVNEHYQTGFGTPLHHEASVFATYSVSPTACTGCHDNSLGMEHKVTDPRGVSFSCALCHGYNAPHTAAPVFTADATSPGLATVTAAVNTVKSDTCTTCHTKSTLMRPHARRSQDATTGEQFDPKWSGHKSVAGMYGSRTGAAGSTLYDASGTATPYTWPLPAQNTWLDASWTPTSPVTCSDCHGAVVGAVGPHGAAMTVNYAPGYDNSYTAGTLKLSSGRMSNTTNLCYKCHSVLSSSANKAHSAGDHSGRSCTGCHNKIPHAWKRPRLLAYTTDPGGYASTGLTGIKLKSYTPSGWSESDCGGCGEHSQRGGW
jgi:hypothetical protein